MNFLTVMLLAFAMSTDAFAVAVCKGVSLNVPKLKDAFKVGLIFGLIEGITPMLGWLCGFLTLHYTEKWDHWIIFLLMLFLGSHMIYNSFHDDDETQEDKNTKKQPLFLLVLTAISTSIDAFAVGIGLALATVNIVFASCMIGAATCLMVTLGILLGKKIGSWIGKRAEFLGGLVLIAIGSITLYQHISA